MQSIFRLLLIFLLAVPVQAGNPRRDDDPLKIPKTMKDQNGRGWAPFWVDATLFDEKGRYIGPRPISEETEKALDRLAQIPQESGCVHIREASIDYLDAPTHRDLPTAIREADFIVEGTVTGRAYGLYDGNIPGQMLSLAVDKELKGYSPLRTYYFYVPVGTFRLGSLAICKTDSRYPSVPQLGDRVIVFGHEGFRSGSFLNTFDEGGFLGISGIGEVALPRRYRAETRERMTESTFAKLAAGRALPKE